MSIGGFWKYYIVINLNRLSFHCLWCENCSINQIFFTYLFIWGSVSDWLCTDDVTVSVCVLSVLESKPSREAVSLVLQQGDTADRQTHNASALQETEHTLTYPSRLIYYLNEASESTFHDLNTHAKTSDQHGQVSLTSQLMCMDPDTLEAEYGGLIVQA